MGQLSILYTFKEKNFVLIHAASVLGLQKCEEKEKKLMNQTIFYGLGMINFLQLATMIIEKMYRYPMAKLGQGHSKYRGIQNPEKIA